LSQIGDQLRQLAEEADSWPDLSSYACVVTKDTALRAWTEFLESKPEMAREQALSMLNGLAFRTKREQERGAAAWCDQ
jgi:hypothetical protein